ncbi:MAG TPA: extracellular solute-binding protein [Steroidobacteraceae bacterium]
MRRYALLSVFLLILLVPLFPPGNPPSGSVDTRQGAVGPASGAEHLVIVTPHLEAVRRKFSTAFSDWYRMNYHASVEVDFLNYGGGSEIVKFFQASRPTFEKLGTYEVDLVWGGSDFLFKDALQKKGYLQKAGIDPAIVAAAFPRADIGGLPLYDPDRENGPQWYGTALSSFGIIYNRDLLRYLRLPEPKTWSDLADPRYRNWLVLADPTRSASAKTVLMTIVEREMATAQEEGLPPSEGWARGMGLVRLIASNAKSFTGAGVLLPSTVTSGDAAAAMSIDFYARTQIAAIEPGRVGYVEPRGATVITPEPIGVVAGAQHLELARRFIEFMLSEPAQRLWITRADPQHESQEMTLRRLPIRRSVYDHPDNFTDYTNPYLAAGDFNTRSDRTSEFGLMDELIAISCIDLLSELRETRREILASPRARELDAKLARFPIDEDASRRGVAAYRRMLSGDPREWLDLQQQWLELFRSEYRGLRELAAVK